jgi:hypothetical protein
VLEVLASYQHDVTPRGQAAVTRIARERGTPFQRHRLSGLEAALRI